MNAPLERPSITAQINTIEKHFGAGSGPSYSASDRQLIADGIVPEWVFRARLILKDGDREWATKLIEGLKKARAELWPKVRFSATETTPPPAAKKGDDH